MYPLVLRLKTVTGLYDARSSFVTSSDSPDICVGSPLVDCTAGASAAFGSVGVGGFAAR